MTAQKAQIESLIQELDEILGKTAPRLPWLMPSDAAKQRQVLEQTRRYLMSLQKAEPQPISEPVALQFPVGIESPALSENRSEAGETAAKTTPPAAETTPEAATREIAAVPAIDRLTPPQPVPTPAPAAQTEVIESAQQALQAVVQEMNYLRSNLLQPMRSDVDVLRQQRETLLQEVRQLEAQRQQYAQPQQNQLLMEFLQAAFRQMQENLSAQVTQMISTLGVQNPSAALPESPNLSLGSSDLMALSPAQRLEQIQRVQTQSDQLLLKLDSSLRIIFNSLQQNVQTYEDSLEQGLSRMHNLGQQGEAMFSALVTRLAEQLGREASTFLQSSIEPGVWEPALPPEELSVEQSAEAQTRQPAPQPEASDITRLLDELGEFNAAQPAQTVSPFAAETQTQDANSLNAFDQLDLELSQLDLDTSPEPFAIVDEDQTLLQDEPLDAFLSTDLTVLQDDSEPEILQPFAHEEPIQSAEDTDDSDDDVLDLLNQVSVEPQEGEQTETQTASPTEEINQGIDPVAEAPSAAEPSFVASPDNLYEDEFYQSLFGDVNPQPITTDDLFADVELAEFGEAPPLLEALDPPAANSAETSSSSTTQEDLFSSFPESEPASELESETMPELEELTIVEAPVLPQTVENVLLPPADLQASMSGTSIAPQSPEGVIAKTAPEANSEVNLDSFAPIESEESFDQDPAPDATEIETVASLLDLVPFESSAPSASDGLASAEPEFELAQPEEDLLADDEPSPDALLNLCLPTETLEQLAQDLSSLEGDDASFTGLDASDWAIPEAAGQSIEPIEDLFFGFDAPDSLQAEPDEQDLLDDTLDQPIAEEAATGNSSQDAFTLEGLESLFEKLPAIESQNQNDPAEQSFDGLDESEPQLSIHSSLNGVISQEESQKKKS